MVLLHRVMITRPGPPPAAVAVTSVGVCSVSIERADVVRAQWECGGANVRINTATAMSQLLIHIQPLTQPQHQQGASSQAIILSAHISADQWIIVNVND